jgi:hypothetical protein
MLSRGLLLCMCMTLAFGAYSPADSPKAPLVADWSAVPKLNDNSVKGSVVITNQDDDDFDQTVIIEAVNEAGKAFALGYQRFTLRRHSQSKPILFESTLPPGRYTVHADAIAEVPSRHAIFRQHLEGPVAFDISTI